MKFIVSVVLILILSCHCLAFAEERTISADKKVVVWGNPPGLASDEAHNQAVVQQIAQWPIDGVVWTPWVSEGKLSWFFFGDQFIPPESWQHLFDAYRRTDFQGQTGHLLCVACVPGDCDWFDDVAWAMILGKARILAELCSVGGFAGLVLDTEQYDGKPFAYYAQPQADRHTYQEYAEQARKRGRQFITAITQVKPDIVVMMTIATAYAAEQLEKGLPGADCDVGLVIPFVDGLLEGCGEATIIDGCEAAYGYKTYAQFADARRLIKETAPKFSNNPELFKNNLKVGFGLWMSLGGQFDPDNFDNNGFRPEELEHALHYALLNSDGFVWLYSAGLDWWRQGVPQPYLEAIRRARQPHALDWQPPQRPTEAAPESPTQPEPEDFPRASSQSDYSDEVTFRRLWGNFVELMDLPKTWQFRLDEDDLGDERGWYAPDFDDSDWDTIQIGEWWEPQGYIYDGVAWYRLALEVPSEIGDRELLLAFGAVDEDTWVYVNGRLVAERAFGGPGWNSPFEVSVTDHIRPGEINLIAVRVQDMVGVGGIWKSIKLITPKQ